jgi:hypothetical protein
MLPVHKMDVMSETKGRRANATGVIANFPASILEKSKTSLIRSNKPLADRWTLLRYSTTSGWAAI